MSTYPLIDLVITQDKDGLYHACGGPREAMFGGSGSSYDEAIGSWYRQNREAVGLQVSFVIDGKFQCSTKYGNGRCREELGPNELKALEKWERENGGQKCDTGSGPWH